jgi:type I restriction enzyme, S subunit
VSIDEIHDRQSAAALPQYPEFRNSGQHWLGKIPTQWGMSTLCRLARVGAKTFVDGDWIESPYITTEGIRLLQTGNIGIGQFKEQGYRYISDDTFAALRCTEVVPGDILICRLADPVGRACIAPDLGVRMITSVDVCILKPSPEHDARFVTYFLSSRQYLQWMQAICRGSTRDRISRSMLAKVSVPIPSISEQRAIASFLDRETAKIDALVAKKERLIALLQEKRAAVISHAVTRGLDPSVPMKDSGVEWLGEVPAHWEVRRLKHLVTGMISGPFGSSLTKEMYSSSGFRVYGQEQVIPADFSIGDYFVNDLKFAELRRYAVSPGDILMSCVGTFGRVAIVPEGVHPGIINPRLLRITPNKTEIIPDYLAVTLSSRYATTQLDTLSRGGTMGVINLGLVSQLIVAVPPVQEQCAIVRFIDESNQRSDALVSMLTKHISLLDERRASLISAAVTGKIDVRGEVSDA